MAKKTDINTKWYLIDAKDKILGRLATKIATVLRGKHKPIYTPGTDCGDGVIVINADKIRTTGKKLQDKIYRSFSGYPGGLKVKNLEEMLKGHPTEVIRLAVKRMLPSGPLARDILQKLKVYASSEHPHKAQNPEAFPPSLK